MTLAQEIEALILAARAKYGEPTSAHESLGVITEEYHELIAAIHRNDRDAVINEALDLAAAAVSLGLATDDGSQEFCLRSGFKE